jgi:hypothetical protein
MLKDAFSSVDNPYKERTIIVCILIALIILTIDYITGRHIQFPLLYVLPIGIAAWKSQKYTAYSMAILLPVARIGFHFPWNETQSLSAAILNSLVSMVALILYAYLVDRVAWQTNLLKIKIRTLEGILPICASCKRIRNEKGEYEQIEKYITEHSEALFSHGICQECAKRLYPELNDKAHKIR